MQSLMFILSIFSACSWFLWAVVSGVRSVQFDRNCTGHLKRAANASTVEVAAGELDIALQHLRANGLTRGYTSVFYRTPDEDVGYWYRNLKAMLAELRAVRPDAPTLERNGLLIKLRGTVLDHGAEGSDEVTKPEGIALYPHNGLFGAWGILSAVLLLLFAIGAIVSR